MNLETLTEFFMWCTIFSGGVYVIWVLLMFVAPDFVYRVQSTWIALPRDTYNIVIYSLMGFFKIVFIVFVIIPYVSLLVIR